jgi:alpha-D-ribose 1-methylphosphonate 5-triphosphate diphosphatase
MTTQLVLTNAKIVLPDQVIDGSVGISGGLIAEIQPGAAAGEDMDGDYLIAGVVDLHTDNLERQVLPRTRARWPSRAALLAHDAQCAAAGITTVFDALCLGEAGGDDDRPRTCREGVADLDAMAGTGLLKSDHILHLRCEMPAVGLLDQLEPLADHKLLRMISLMDHTPGFGQYSDLVAHRAGRAREGRTEDEIEAELATLYDQRAKLRGPNRQALLARMAGYPVTIASHDDATEAEIAENVADGILVSEFPVSLVAARAARNSGMAIIGGAPNLVRGGSHSGNVAVAELLQHGLIDALASDYVPPSLVHAAFLAASITGMALPAAIALVTQAPARIAALHDRGAIAPGLRADLVRVRVHQGVPVVRQVWLAGNRVI